MFSNPLNLSAGSSAGGTASFGNVTGGGSSDWKTWAVILGGVLLAVVLWKTLR